MNVRAENNIKEWLLPLLDARGMSVEQLARAVDLTRATVYLYFQDKARPTDERMHQICSVLGVPVEEGLNQFTPRTPGRKKGQSGRYSINLG